MAKTVNDAAIDPAIARLASIQRELTGTSHFQSKLWDARREGCEADTVGEKEQETEHRGDIRVQIIP